MPRYELTGTDLNAYVEANPCSLSQPTADLCRFCTPDESDIETLSASWGEHLPPATSASSGASHPCYGEVYPAYRCDLCETELTARDN